MRIFTVSTSFLTLACLVSACAQSVAIVPASEAASAAAAPLLSVPAAAPGSQTGMAATPAPRATMPAQPTVRGGTFIFYEDFERGFDRWQFSDQSGPVAFRALNAPTCSGAWALLLGTKDHTDYTASPGTHTITLREPIDLSKAKAPYLKYDYRAKIEPASSVDLTLEVREAGKADWQVLGERMDGGFPYMLTFVEDLGAWVGKRLELRFHAVMQAGTTPTKGAYLDDVQVVEPRE